MKYLVTNRSLGVRVVYDAHRRPHKLRPDQRIEMDFDESSLKIARREFALKFDLLSRDPVPVRSLRRRDERGVTHIPKDWRSLPWPDKRRLAVTIGTRPVRKRADAEMAIEEELARRRSEELNK